MVSTSVREKLYEYIEHAEEKKVQAIYTLIENEITDRKDLYDEATLASFRAINDDYFAGKIEAYPMEESLQRIREKISA